MDKNSKNTSRIQMLLASHFAAHKLCVTGRQLLVAAQPGNTVCGVNFIILDSRRVLAPAPKDFAPF